MSPVNHSASLKLSFIVIPGGELAGSHAALGFLKDDIETVATTDEPCLLQRLTVSDSHKAIPLLSFSKGKGRPHPMDVARFYAESATVEAGMVLPLSYIYYIVGHIRGYDEQRVLVAADIQPVPLPDGIELRAVVTACKLSVLF